MMSEEGQPPVPDQPGELSTRVSGRTKLLVMSNGGNPSGIDNGYSVTGALYLADGRIQCAVDMLWRAEIAQASEWFGSEALH